MHKTYVLRREKETLNLSFYRVLYISNINAHNKCFKHPTRDCSLNRTRELRLRYHDGSKNTDKSANVTMPEREKGETETQTSK